MPILMARLTVPFCKGDKFTEPGLTFNGADRSGKKRFYSIDPLASHFLNRRSQLLLTSIKKKKKNSWVKRDWTKEREGGGKINQFEAKLLWCHSRGFVVRAFVCVLLIHEISHSEGEREREREIGTLSVGVFVCGWERERERESPRRDKNEVASCADRQTEAKNGFDQSFFFFHLPTT